MAQPEADRCDVDEPEEALGGFVVTGSDASGVLQFVEAPFDEVLEPVELAVDGHAQFPGFSHRDHVNGKRFLRTTAFSA